MEPSTAVSRHYDQLDRFYRELWGEHVHHGLWTDGDETPGEAVEALVRCVAERARIGPGDRVCDAGSGYGAPARLLVRERGARVTALTVSRLQHRHAVAAAPGPNPRHLLRDWLANELPAGRFDAVLAIESTEHMADPSQAFREARRVLRPGGRCVVCAWLAAHRPPGWAHRFLLDPIRREGRLAWLPTLSTLQRTMEDAGLEVQRGEDVSRRVRRTWTICLRRLGKALVQRPEYRRFILDGGREERVFALTMVRIWLAYRVGAMRYAIVTARRPGGAVETG